MSLSKNSRNVSMTRFVSRGIGTAACTEGDTHGVHRIERTHGGGDKQDRTGRGYDDSLPRHRHGRTGDLLALLWSWHDGVDHLLQDHRGAGAALPVHPH